MSDFTFLTENQIDQLDLIRKYGRLCSITDFSILLGGLASSQFYTSEGNTIKNRACSWWSKSPISKDDVYGIHKRGIGMKLEINCRTIGARPAIPYSSIKLYSKNEIINFRGIKEVEYGEYPQTVVGENYAYEIERAYHIGILKPTGKQYTTDSVPYNDYDTSFKARVHSEYEYNGQKYIRFVADLNSDGKILTDNRKVKAGNVYWVLVEPIVWLIDEKDDIALSKQAIFSGVQFKCKDYDGDFSKTDIKQFMDNNFSKEILPTKVYSQISTEPIKSLEVKESLRKRNPYGFNFDEVTEEDIIKGAIKSNVPVFLHGKSSEGKSARVKQLDPDCEIIYMSNATPDSLNGKSVYNADTGVMFDVPPTWYKKVLEKCNAEPNKIHIIFFDELTNALPSIQGMAFNIILNGEVNGIWKLPPNARIVAAGNDLEDSLAANRMVEPLFNRFAHVYIKTTVSSWLKWASTPNEEYERLDYNETKTNPKIHPSIFSYVAYKSFCNQDVLRTPYTGDKPNADPRKWEMGSKLLYKTNQPEMLRALIGEELTKDFIAFAKQQVISVEDVINHNYSSQDLEMDVSQKFATAVGLSSVDEKNFEIVREFMKQIGAEPRAVFESIWTHNDERRLEKLAELQMAESFSQGGMKR